MTVTGLLTAVIAVVAVGAWLVAAVSAFRAWAISESHEPYRALGIGRFDWINAMNFMPLEAKRHLVRHFKSAGVFILAGIALMFVFPRS